MDDLKIMQALCGFQLWLGENYKTLPTNSAEVTARARLYVQLQKKRKK